MLCLGVESSCDDSSLALVRDGRLLKQVESSQERVHALFGGVVPEIASREHAKYLGPLCDMLFAEAGVSPQDVDVVAAARGPGLLGSLLVGMAFAKAFALGCGARFIGVNHLHAHILAASIEQPMPFPTVALLVSGGHTHLYYVEGARRFTVLGRTLDDAAGEAFDKAGKLLGLPYPAGRHVDGLAERGSADKKLFPRPYLDNDSLDFSFSGLKTAMATYLAGHPSLRTVFCAQDGTFVTPPDAEKRSALEDVCASYRLAVVDTLVEKTRRALARFPKARALALAGGVAANALLRRRMAALAEEFGMEFRAPSPSLCTDNGTMIAYTGFLLAEEGCEHDLSVEAIPRGRAVPDDMRIAARNA